MPSDIDFLSVKTSDLKLLISSEDYDLIDLANFEDDFRDIFRIIQSNSYFIIGMYLGWKNKTACVLTRTEEPLDLLYMIIPKQQDYSIEIYQGTLRNNLLLVLYNHDSPTGEYYHIISYFRAKKLKIFDKYVNRFGCNDKIIGSIIYASDNDLY